MLVADGFEPYFPEHLREFLGYIIVSLIFHPLFDLNNYAGLLFRTSYTCSNISHSFPDEDSLCVQQAVSISG